MNSETLFNRYVGGELSADEQKLFDELYDQDTLFKARVDHHQELVQGIQAIPDQSIRQEVGEVHQVEIKKTWDNIEFEADVTKALKFKNQETIRSGEDTSLKKDQQRVTKSNGRIFFIGQSKVFAIAASILLVISLALTYNWFTRSSGEGIWQEALTQAYDQIKQGAQTSGLADPDQGYRNLQKLVFDLLDQSESEKAMVAIEGYFINHPRDFTYHQLKAWVYFKNKKWDQARTAFQAAVLEGDSCLSKLYYALMIKNSQEFGKLILEVKQNASCMELELVRSLLTRQGL
ncbi:MAG: hypothetical protein SH818_13700 [Saprospiraceae bacterium]|nr:hypothetical protein [Saprospiraceae bacterium]